MMPSLLELNINGATVREFSSHIQNSDPTPTESQSIAFRLGQMAMWLKSEEAKGFEDVLNDRFTMAEEFGQSLRRVSADALQLVEKLLNLDGFVRDVDSEDLEMLRHARTMFRGVIIRVDERWPKPVSEEVLAKSLAAYERGEFIDAEDLHRELSSQN